MRPVHLLWRWRAEDSIDLAAMCAGFQIDCTVQLLAYFIQWY